MDVATDRIPDSTEALATICQLTSPMAAAEPTVAINVCAMVLTARLAAACAHCLVSTSVLNTLFLNLISHLLSQNNFHFKNRAAAAPATAPINAPINLSHSRPGLAFNSVTSSVN